MNKTNQIPPVRNPSYPAGEPVAWLWEYVGSDPYTRAAHGKRGSPIALSITEMDPKNPPYPEWKPIAPLYTGNP